MPWLSILVHEVYSADRFVTSQPLRRYHADAHLGRRLAAIATRQAPAVLYHQLFWGTDDEGLMRGAARYDGPVVSGGIRGLPMERGPRRRARLPFGAPSRSFLPSSL